MRGLALCIVLDAAAGAARPAIAGGLVTTTSPRSIGRAGAGTIGDDGGGALLANPATMARRESAHGELGLAFVDDEIAWQSNAAGAPQARDQAPSSIAPYSAAFATWGGWTIGAGAMTTAVSERELRPPSDVTPPNIDAAFDYRYNGIAGAIRRDTVTVGIARRIGDQFAVGVAVGGSRLTVTEVRRLWAGFKDRNDVIGAADHDLELGFTGDDKLVPNVVAGVFFAPDDTTLELGASVAWWGKAHVDAQAFATGTLPDGPSASPDTVRATIDIEQPLVVRAGARYLGDRFVLELGGELARVRKTARDNAWTVRGMRVVDGMTRFEADLQTVPSRWSMRTHGAVRTAVDAEIIAGFLWATLGYAHVVGSVTNAKQSPTFGDLGGETFGFGLEGKAGGFTITLGWSRTWSATRTVGETEFRLDNPFGEAAGDAAVPAGSYDGSIDQIGVLVDVEI